MASATLRSIVRYQGSGTLGLDVIPSEIHPTGLALYDLIRVPNAHYGSLLRAAYREPFMTQETVRVDEVVTTGVRSI